MIIPTYNRAELLPRALDSVIGQSFGDWEIVLVDDGSTDDTPAVVGRYADRLGDRFKFIRQQNSGSSAARNRGIDEAGGEFVAFLDSDDEFLPDKLGRQLELFERRPDVGFVYSDYAYVDGDGIRCESVFDTKCPRARSVDYKEIAPGLCVCPADLFDVLIAEYFIATIVGMVRRKVLGSTIRFPEGLSYAEEWLFHLKVVRACRAGFVDEPLCLHHHVAGSLARTDRHDNSIRLRDLLRTMLRELSPLTKCQKKTVRANLAHVCRQLGFDAWRGGRRAEAVRRFAEAMVNRPSGRTLLDLLQSCGRLALPKSGANQSRATLAQESSQPVR